MRNKYWKVPKWRKKGSKETNPVKMISPSLICIWAKYWWQHNTVWQWSHVGFLGHILEMDYAPTSYQKQNKNLHQCNFVHVSGLELKLHTWPKQVQLLLMYNLWNCRYPRRHTPSITPQWDFMTQIFTTTPTHIFCVFLKTYRLILVVKIV